MIYSAVLLCIFTLVPLGSTISTRQMQVDMDMSMKKLMNIQDSLSTKTRLTKYLLDGYDKIVGPSGIKVGFGVSLTKILKVDGEVGIFKGIAWLKMKWNDPRLTWNLKDFNITSIALPARLFWLPDIVLYEYIGNYKDGLTSVQVLIMNNGDVLYIPPLYIKSGYSVNESNTKPPGKNTKGKVQDREIQTVTLKFGSWATHKGVTDLVYYDDKSSVDIGYLMPSNYKLLSSSYIIENIKYSCCTEIYPAAKIKLVIEGPKTKKGDE